MSIQIRGSLLPYLQNETWEFDPQRGFLHIYDFKGASQALMANLQMDYVRAGIACRLVYHQGDMASFDVNDSTMQYTIDVWQIIGNSENRDGLSNPRLIAALDGFDVDAIIADMRQALADQTSPADAFADGSPLAGAPAEVQRAYSRQQRGSTEYRRQQYVVRHTTNCSNVFPRNIADIGVDCIYTMAEFLSESQDSGLWILPLPSSMAYALGAIPQPVSQPFYQWGWLKSAPTRTTAPNNRVDINTEFTLEQWSTDEYQPF